LPALKVNIIIVHPRGVVFPRENNISRVKNYDVHYTRNHIYGRRKLTNTVIIVPDITFRSHKYMMYIDTKTFM
jgi:hypothetical protein